MGLNLERGRPVALSRTTCCEGKVTLSARAPCPEKPVGATSAPGMSGTVPDVAQSDMAPSARAQGPDLTTVVS